MKLRGSFNHVSFWLRTAAMLTLVALALMVWSVLQPTPLPVMLAMTLGQGIGTTAFAIFGIIVLKDLTRVRRARRESLENIALKAMQTIALTNDGLAPRDSLQNIGLTKDEPASKDES